MPESLKPETPVLFSDMSQQILFGLNQFDLGFYTVGKLMTSN